MKEKKHNLLGNLSWKFAERISAQAVTTIVSIILARILDPSHYGTVAIVTIFITLANVFVSDGFGSALIQKKNADALDFSSVLYANLAVAAGLYAILFFCAPAITRFYGEGYEQLTSVLRVLGLRLILTAVNSVQQAYISKKMMFRKFFWATLFGTILSAFVGITMAYSGYGVWALVCQYLTNTIVDTIVLAITMKKRPMLAFSLHRLKGLFGFGLKILSTNLFIHIYKEMRAIIIGKVYSAQDLAFFDKGKHFPALIITNVNTTISQVLFPKLSADQDDVGKVKNSTKNAIRFSSFLMCPLMIGLAAVSKNFIIVLLTEKWLPCVPLLVYASIDFLFYPIHSTNMQAMKAMGRGDLLMKIEIFKKIIELIVLLSVMFISVEAIAIAMAACSTVFVIVNAWPNRKLISYPLKEQLADLFPALAMSAIMAMAVLGVGLLPFAPLPALVMQVIVGAVVYIVLAVTTRNPEFRFLYGLVKKRS